MSDSEEFPWALAEYGIAVETLKTVDVMHGISCYSSIGTYDHSEESYTR